MWDFVKVSDGYDDIENKDGNNDIENQKPVNARSPSSSPPSVTECARKQLAKASMSRTNQY